MIEASKTAQFDEKTTYTEETFMKGLNKVAADCLGRLLGVKCSWRKEIGRRSSVTRTKKLRWPGSVPSRLFS